MYPMLPILRPAKVDEEDDDCEPWLTIWGLPSCWYDEQEEEEMRSKSLEYFQYDDDSMSEEIPNEDETSTGGEAKRIKLEHDPHRFSDSTSPSPSSTASAGHSIHEFNSNRDQEFEDLRAKFFEFNLKLSGCDSIQHDSSPDEILDSMRDDALSTEHARSLIQRKILFKTFILDIKNLYEAVKRLYEHVPYITFGKTVREVKGMVDLKSSPFADLDDTDLDRAIKIYQSLLYETEGFFHPIIRKSNKNEFFSIVDTKQKLEERHFFMTRWRTFWSVVKGSSLLKLSVGSGLRDKEYEHCCRQIRLQEQFDYYLYGCKNVKHDSIIEDLLCDEAVFPEKFKDLDPELKRLSLKACIKVRNLDEECERFYKQLQLLENAHGKNETTDIDKMLIDLHSEFPGIFSSPMVDNALEERLKDATDKMKVTWFPRIADHRVLQITLLYMKHLVSECEAEEPSWSTEISEKMTFFGFKPHEICHDHRLYQHVMDVEFRLA